MLGEAVCCTGLGGGSFIPAGGGNIGLGDDDGRDSECCTPGLAT